MAAKLNTTKRISLRDGSNVKNQFSPNNPIGGGTRMTGSSAGFKTRNDRGASGGVSTGVKAPDFGAARGIQKNSGNTGGNQY
jgi:hypothetical protein